MAFPLYSKANILTQVRTILNEPTARFYSDSEINSWTDRGARILSAISLCYDTTQADVGMTAETPLLAINDFIRVDAVINDEDTGLQRISPQMAGHVNVHTSGDPQFYFHFEDSIWLCPAPDATAVAAGSLDIYGCAIVGSYGAAAAETLPDELQYMVIDFVLSQAYTKAGKHRLSGIHMQKFMEEAMLARRDVYDSLNIVNSNDQFKLPDTTITPQPTQTRQTQ